MHARPGRDAEDSERDRLRRAYVEANEAVCRLEDVAFRCLEFGDKGPVLGEAIERLRQAMQDVQHALEG